MKILVSTDNFLVGGRETYLSTYLDGLRTFGWTAHLLARRVSLDTPEVSCFERVVTSSAEARVSAVSDWLEKGVSIIESWRPDLIWTHHFDALPAWILSSHYNVPLLTTFHGPLIGAGRPNRPLEALGMTMAIHRGTAVSGVSDEVVEGIASLNHAADIAFTPNTVHVDSGSLRAGRPSKLSKFVVVTRAEKLEHIRLGVRVFSEFRRRTGRGRLSIAAGSDANSRVAERPRIYGRLENLKRVVELLGAKWCLSENREVKRALLSIEMLGYTDHARALMRASDVVLGMGRVLLEGLAEGKAAMLIGYDRICGPVSGESLPRFRKANFSGRGCSSMTASAAVDMLLRGEWGISPDELASIATEGAVRPLHELLSRVARRKRAEDARPDGLEIAYKTSEAELFQSLAASLSPAEWATFYRVAEG